MVMKVKAIENNNTPFKLKDQFRLLLKHEDSVRNKFGPRWYLKMKASPKFC